MFEILPAVTSMLKTKEVRNFTGEGRGVGDGKFYGGEG